MGDQIGQIPDSLITNQYSKSLKGLNEYSALYIILYECV